MTQRNKEFFEEFLYDCKEGETDDVIEFNIGYIPYSIERVSDGEILYLNPDNKTYSYPSEKFFESEYSNKWTYARLFMDHRCQNAFKAIGWAKIENLESIHRVLKK